MKKDSMQPIYILPENTERSSGSDAQKNNILAAKLVAETVRTTLGPKGMDKMLVDSFGDVTITNDGVTILRELDVDHPTAKMIVEIAKTQEDEVGDGTTTAVVIAGELLKKAESLLENNIHPSIITKGYREASKKAEEILNEISEKITSENKDLLRKIAITAMTGKGAENAKDKLSEIVINSVLSIIEEKDNEIKNKLTLDKDNIKIEKKTGGSIEDSELIKGIIVDKSKVHSGMPSQIKNAKIALLNTELEIKNLEIDTKITITSPEQMQGFIDQEEKILKNMVDKISESGANVVLCQKGIDEIAQHFLAKKGIYALRRIPSSDMEKIAKATNGKIISNFMDLNQNDLGTAGIVEEIKFGDEKMTYIRECENPKAVTIMIRGATEHVIEEIKKAVEDAIGDVVSALKTGKIVAGAGATEIELEKKIHEFGNTKSGKEQLAINAFANALEIIPKTLAENSGLDSIEVLATLKNEHQNNKWAGINVFSGKVMDAWEEGVIEPLKIKTQAISSATEVAIMILRIDDIIASSGNSKRKNNSINID